MKERLKKQIKFIKEIDKEKTITRQTLLTNGIQKEDDAQHLSLIHISEPTRH